jgi:hypothetical protein
VDEGAEEYILVMEGRAMKPRYRQLIKRTAWIVIALLGIGFPLAAAAL